VLIWQVASQNTPKTRTILVLDSVAEILASSSANSMVEATVQSITVLNDLIVQASNRTLGIVPGLSILQWTFQCAGMRMKQSAKQLRAAMMQQHL
jgi:hypothetical protein